MAKKRDLESVWRELSEIINFGATSKLKVNEYVNTNFFPHVSTIRKEGDGMKIRISLGAIRGEIWYVAPDIDKLTAIVKTVVRSGSLLSYNDVGRLTLGGDQDELFSISAFLKSTVEHRMDVGLETLRKYVTEFEAAILSCFYLFIANIMGRHECMSCTKIPFERLRLHYHYEELTLVDGTKLELACN